LADFEQIVYPEHFNVVSIKELIASNINTHRAEDIKLAKTDVGEALMHYALTETTSDLDDVHLQSNISRDPRVYHLVYGTVHKDYTHVAVQLLDSVLKKHKTESAETKTAAANKNYETTMLSQGEIEIMIYVYILAARHPRPSELEG
jgi:hypothetical protein